MAAVDCAMMGTEALGIVPHKPEDSARKEVGLDRAETEPNSPGRIQKEPEQAGQSIAIIPLPGREMDTRQDDLLVALGLQSVHFLEQLLSRETAAPPPDIRNDTKGAKLIAPVLDPQEGPRALLRQTALQVEGAWAALGPKESQDTLALIRR